MSNESKSFGVIYIVINLITGKWYIGQTTRTLIERKNDHISDSKYKKDNIYFHKAIRKYGEDNFEWKVLCECSSKDKLDEMEKYYIKLYNTKVPNGYNLTDGGGGISGWKHNEETKNKLSILNSGKNNSFYGKYHTDETKKKISENHVGMLGRKHNNETKKKIGKSNSKKYIIKYLLTNEIITIYCLKTWCDEMGFNYNSIRTTISMNRVYKNKYLIKKVEDNYE